MTRPFIGSIRLHCKILYAVCEIDFNDNFKVAYMLKEDIVLICAGPVEPLLLTELGEATLNKLYNREFPDKRNMVFHFNDPVDLGKCK